MRFDNELRRDLQWETIFGQVVSKANNYQAVPDGKGGRRIIKSEKMRQYERSFAKQCRLYRNMGIDRPFILHAVVYESTWAYDLDNALKGTLDCLQSAKAITNDNLCIAINARKAIDSHNPRLMFAIEETEPRLFT